MKDEVQTHAFIEKWSRSKRIILPVVTGDELELRVYTGPQDLAIGSYGIAEPTGAPFTDYKGKEIVLHINMGRIKKFCLISALIKTILIFYRKKMGNCDRL